MKCSCNCNKIKETKVFQDIFTVSLQNYFFFTEYPRLLCNIGVHCFNGFYVVLLIFFLIFWCISWREKESVQRSLEVCLSVSYLLPVFLVSSLLGNLLFSLPLCGWSKQQKAFWIIQSSPEFLHLPVQFFITPY